MKVSSVILAGLFVCTMQAAELKTKTTPQSLKEWVSQNKGKIAAIGATVAALAGSAYTVAQQPSLKVIRVFEDKRVNLPLDTEIKNSLYSLGLLVEQQGIQGLRDLLEQKPGFRNDLTIMFAAYSNLDAALAELARVSVDEIRRLLYAQRKIILR